MDMPAERHKELGIALFNETWDYLDMPSRTLAEDFHMMDLAHASAYHWSFAGDHVNTLRSQWQLSRVYAVLKMGQASLAHAERSLSLCMEHGVQGLDLAFAYEAVARACGVLGDIARKEEFRKKALEAAAGIGGADDRAYTEREIGNIP